MLRALLASLLLTALYARALTGAERRTPVRARRGKRPPSSSAGAKTRTRYVDDPGFVETATSRPWKCIGASRRGRADAGPGLRECDAAGGRPYGSRTRSGSRLGRGRPVICLDPLVSSFLLLGAIQGSRRRVASTTGAPRHGLGRHQAARLASALRAPSSRGSPLSLTTTRKRLPWLAADVPPPVLLEQNFFSAGRTRRAAATPDPRAQKINLASCKTLARGKSRLARASPSHRYLCKQGPTTTRQHTTAAAACRNHR